MRLYRRWDDRVYQRLMLSRRFTAVILVMMNVVAAGLFVIAYFKIPPPATVRRIVSLIITLAFIAMINVLFAFRMREQLKEQRTKAGLCLHCGYDLRQSVARCPECGVKF